MTCVRAERRNRGVRDERAARRVYLSCPLSERAAPPSPCARPSSPRLVLLSPTPDLSSSSRTRRLFVPFTTLVTPSPSSIAASLSIFSLSSSHRLSAFLPSFSPSPLGARYKTQNINPSLFQHDDSKYTLVLSPPRYRAAATLSFISSFPDANRPAIFHPLVFREPGHSSSYLYALLLFFSFSPSLCGVSPPLSPMFHAGSHRYHPPPFPHRGR